MAPVPLVQCSGNPIRIESLSMGRKPRSTSAGTVAVFCVIVALLGYGFLIEPFWLEVTTHHLGLIKSADRIRLVQISDLHLKHFGDRESAVAERLHALKPDVIVLSGDLVDRAEVLPALEQFLAALPNAQKFAVLGNWEYWSEVDVKALKALYETRHGVRLLVNQVETITVRDKSVRLFGLDDFTAGLPDPGLIGRLEPFAGITVLLEHSPGYFSSPTVKPSAQKIDLCLSGHTHAGQITMFGVPLWKPQGSGDFTAGWYDTPTCRLYVSRGIGTSVLPARFGARPEIAVFDL